MAKLEKTQANQFYNQIIESYQNNQGNFKAAIREMRITFEGVFKALTAGQAQSFSNLFARTVFVMQTERVPIELEGDITGFRKFANKVAHEEGFEVKEIQFKAAIKALANLIQFFSEEAQPNALVDLYASGGIAPRNGGVEFGTQKRKAAGELIETIKCIVLKIGDVVTTEGGVKYFELTCEGEEELESFTIKLWDTNYNILTDLYVLLWEYATIMISNFKKVEGREKEYTSIGKTQVIIEPDFLIDSSDVAECFQFNGANPNLYLLSKLVDSEPGEAAFKGTIVNNLLDSIIREPEKTFEAVYSSSIQENALKAAVFGKDTMGKIENEIKVLHYETLKKVAERFKNNQLKIEPTFFSAKYGIQGRLDAMIEYEGDKDRKDVFELKSGKAPSGTAVWENNRKQITCYNMLLSSTFGESRNGASMIFYSSSTEMPLRSVEAMQKDQNEVIIVRNRILTRLFRIARKDFSPLRLFDPLKFGVIPSFKTDQLNIFKKTMDEISGLEKSYYLNFLTFLFREHQTAKVGSFEHNGRDDNGFAGLWLDSLTEKEKRFNVIHGLRFLSFDQYTNTVYFDWDKVVDHNFRDGDIGILYPKTGDELEPLKWQILKGSISGISKKGLNFVLRNKQIDEQYFENQPDWAIEHDLFESNYWEIVQSLFDFIKGKQRIKDLVLGRIKPEKIDGPYENDQELNGNQNDILRKAIEAKDYFLMQGPPGTGKTSTMLIKLAQNILKSTKDNLVILAFTNRAVEEICNKLRNNSVKFLRLGSKSYGADEDFVTGVEGKNVEQIRNYVKDHRVFVSTVASFSKRVKDLLELVSVQSLIVDEASQLTEPQLVGLISKFDKFVLIGDQNQLPAVVSQSESLTQVDNELMVEAGFEDLSQSLFERLYKKCSQEGWDHAYGMLENHYRMHESISGLLNQYYGNRLLAGKEDQKVAFNSFDSESTNSIERLLSKSRTIFIQSGKTATTKTNFEEAEKVVEILKVIKKKYGDRFNKKTVGVVTPWRAQIVLIKSKIDDEELLEKVTIDTIERFQGSEKEIIIVSLAIYNSNQVRSMQSVSYDGLVDRKLLVTLSRAMEQVVVLGFLPALENSPYYLDMVERIRGNNGFVDYRTGMQAFGMEF